jgi:prepilin-type N-terminal cleavage/methylation domain-containing protein
MARPSFHDARAGGFTLVELLVAITILGVIAGGISATFTVLARTSNQTEARLEQSRGPKFASAYWTPDVASSETVNAAGVRCGSAGTELVTFTWTDDRQAQAQVATWALVTTGGTTDLDRSICDANALAAPKRTTVVAPDVEVANVSARCDYGSGLAVCTASSTPQRVVLSFVSSDGRTFVIDANRQVS